MPSDNLTTLAEMALSNARRQIEATGTLTFRTALQLPDGRVMWTDLPEKLAPIMNDHQLKTILFNALRLAVAESEATAVIIVTDSWFGVPTEKQKRMAEEDPEGLCRLAKSLDLTSMIEQGLCIRTEAVTVTVQPPEEALILNQLYNRHEGGRRIAWGERINHRCPQSEYS